ncbi:hypothetical protein WJ36_02845 [Burkholderia ubonensis]|uniref:hypothetical protein n=1 Tax=Burkholderia ubonensis TaxID=101571 RepID=UPI00076C90D0|nr:hypothetical protein [Burkholderia ubonensis]KVG81610.1 hypothetical protein WJ36_02845 [Burkholderia ubonensis]
MKERIVKGIFSLNGASLIIGAAGFLSALVTMFVDVTAQISVKWIIFVVFFLSSFVLILLKIISDLSIEKKPAPPFEKPIRYLDDSKIFVIRRNENFLNSIIVGCYLQRDGVDMLAYLAVVHLVQEKVIQIKIHSDLGLLPSGNLLPEDLNAIEIRPVVPVTALERFASGVIDE